jgi:hypothetical protein
MERRSTADFLLGAVLREGHRVTLAALFRLRMDRKIPPGRDNTITRLFLKLNLMLSSRPRLQPLAVGLHLGAQAFYEMRRIG